jgi:hypothetical protein
VFFPKKAAKVFESLLENFQEIPKILFTKYQKFMENPSLVTLLEARWSVVVVAQASKGPLEYTRVIHYKLG